MADIARRVGTNQGFVGCVQELIINHHRYDFREKGLVGESEFGINVGKAFNIQSLICHVFGLLSSANSKPLLGIFGYMFFLLQTNRLFKVQ